MIAAGSAVFVDTNVLIAGSAPSHPLHHLATALVDRWPTRGIELCVSPQVIREYLVVSTREEKHNGLGLSLKDALFNAESILARVRMLDETEEVAVYLRHLLLSSKVSGKR